MLGSPVDHKLGNIIAGGWATCLLARDAVP
jgi:hypothetical protein